MNTTSFIIEIVTQAFIVYVLAVLICESFIFSGFRDGVNAVFHRIGLTKLTKDGSYEFISCRLCVGFWLSVMVCLVLRHSPEVGLAGYGVAVYLESTERI